MSEDFKLGHYPTERKEGRGRIPESRVRGMLDLLQ